MATNFTINDGLLLPITSQPPDQLGIGNVSGFYGPGAWAGWFLTIIASWYNILHHRSKSKRIHDVLMYVVFTNWAAIDLLRQLHAIQSREREHNEEKAQDVHRYSEYGPMGAAITITYWGLFNTFLQLGVSSIPFDGNSRYSIWVQRRSVVLVLGLALPSFSLAKLLRYLLTALQNKGRTGLLIPAFYIPEMLQSTHGPILISICGFATWPMTCSALSTPFVVIYLTVTCFPKRFKNEDTNGMSFAPGIFGGMALISFPLSALVSLFVTDSYKEMNDWRFWIWGPLSLLWIFVSHVILIFLNFLYMWFYFISMLISGGKHGCYFKPCAPQNIKEWDQAFGLLIGIIVILFEVGPVARRWTLRLVGRLLHRSRVIPNSWAV